MNKSRFAVVLDTLLLHAVFFVASFLLFRSILSSTQSYLAAAGATIALFAALAFFRQRRKKGYDAAYAQERFLQFCLDPAYARAYFTRLLGATPCGPGLSAEDTLYVPIFLPAPIDFSRALPAYRFACRKGFANLVYLTAAGLDGSAQTLCSLDGPRVEVLSEENTFALMTEPIEITIKRKTGKQRFALVKHALDRKNARRYLGAALALFLFSYLMPYSVYYLAFACICTALGVVSFFHPTDRKKPSSRQNSKRA